MLRSLSQQTGGRVFFVDDLAQLAGIYARIADELSRAVQPRLLVEERRARRRLAPRAGAGASKAMRAARTRDRATTHPNAER